MAWRERGHAPYRSEIDDVMAAAGVERRRGLSQSEAEPLTILAVLLLNATLGFVQEGTGRSDRPSRPSRARARSEPGGASVAPPG